MPEIKIKHLVSFSSEDKVHKAENILKSETYRKWKCATSGEKNASVVLQFENATQIHSIDIGNESSAFVEVLVGRSSDTVSSFQVLLVASSFMSPLESRNETHNNRVRMFGPDKLAQNLKEEKWDCVQVVCTQPFNKNITYGLSFIKFHSPPEKHSEQPSETTVKQTSTLGAFRIKYEDDDDEENSPTLTASWMDRKNAQKASKNSFEGTSSSVSTPSTAGLGTSHQGTSVKRKSDPEDSLSTPPTKKENKERVNVLERKEDAQSPLNRRKEEKNEPRDIFGLKKNVDKAATSAGNSTNSVKTDNQKDKKVTFNNLMSKVVFVISGFVNPLRSDIRDKALEMGAKYKGDWDSSCTHLICAFVNTPKYTQVRAAGGRIVTKDWIMDCHKKKLLYPWQKYMLGNYSVDSSESESDLEIEIKPKKLKPSPKVNGTKAKASKDAAPPTTSNHNAERNKPINEESLSEENGKKPVTASTEEYSVKENGTKPAKTLKADDSETEDEDALQDYMADTDVDKSDSGGDTEDEILKVEMKAQEKAAQSSKVSDEEMVSDDDDTSLLPPSKPDTSSLPLPELPNLFKKRHFFLYGQFPPATYHDLQRYITAYNGVIEDYMRDTVKYVVTESRWNKEFDEAIEANEDLIFVKPDWILKCHEAVKLVPYQPFIIIPNT